MKVLQVLPYYHPAHRYGGPVVSVHGLSRHLVKLGVKVTVFTTNLDGPQDLDVPLEREVWLDGVRVFYFPVRPPRFYVRAPLLAASLSQRVSEFDLVHIHGLYLYPTMVASRICRKRGVPYIIAPRGMLDPGAIRMRSRVRKRLYLWLIEKRNVDSAAALHFTSAKERMLAQTLGLRTCCFVVPNGLDLASLADRGGLTGETNIRSSSTVLFLGRIDPKKGLDLLVPAFAQAAAAVPEARLVLAGPDNSGYMKVVEKMIARHGLQPSVSYVGMLLGEEKLEALRSAAVLVLPSYSESFGMAVIEALACGTPVIISDQVNIHEEIASADAGLVTPCEPEALARAILFLLRNPDTAETMGQNGRALIEEKHSWDHIARAMLDVYRQVLDSKGHLQVTR